MLLGLLAQQLFERDVSALQILAPQQIVHPTQQQQTHVDSRRAEVVENADIKKAGRDNHLRDRDEPDRANFQFETRAVGVFRLARSPDAAT